MAETLDRVGARQVTELTESERAPYQAFVRQTESFGKRLGEAAPSWTVVESMPSDIAAYDRKTNTILLSREALASEDTTAEALRQSWFGVTVEEYMHRLNNSDSGRSYAEMFGLFSRAEQDAVLDRLVEDGYLDEYADSRSEQRKLLDRVLNKNELTAEEQRVQDMLYDEMIAHLMRDELSTKHFYKMVAEKKPGLLQGLLDRIRAFGKGTGAVGEAVSERAAKAEQLFTDALSEVGYEVSAGKVVGVGDEEESELRYSLREEFTNEFEEWMKIDPAKRAADGGYFMIGRTSNTLKKIGIKDANIYWRKSKIQMIMEDHPNIDDKVIKNIPGIIENPIIVMKSQTRDDSIVVFGNLKVNNRLVMAAIDLTPKRTSGMEAEFNLITSAYDRSDFNAQNLFLKSETLYVAEKSRADTLLMSLRVQFPSDQQAYGSAIGIISYKDGKVNIKGK